MSTELSTQNTSGIPTEDLSIRSEYTYVADPREAPELPQTCLTPKVISGQKVSYHGKIETPEGIRLRVRPVDPAPSDLGYCAVSLESGGYNTVAPGTLHPVDP